MGKSRERAKRKEGGKDLAQSMIGFVAEDTASGARFRRERVLALDLPLVGGGLELDEGLGVLRVMDERNEMMVLGQRLMAVSLRFARTFHCVSFWAGLLLSPSRGFAGNAAPIFVAAFRGLSRPPFFLIRFLRILIPLILDVSRTRFAFRELFS
jgi:hypothetical protein